MGNWDVDAGSDIAIRVFAHSNKVPNPRTIPIELFVKSESLQVGAPLLVLGFPLGLKSDQNSKPIARRGLISRVDGLEVIIETFSFPGNSGGPVIYAPLIKTGMD